MSFHSNLLFKSTAFSFLSSFQRLIKLLIVSPTTLILITLFIWNFLLLDLFPLTNRRIPPSLAQQFLFRTPLFQIVKGVMGCGVTPFSFLSEFRIDFDIIINQLVFSAQWDHFLLFLDVQLPNCCVVCRRARFAIAYFLIYHYFLKLNWPLDRRAAA